MIREKRCRAAPGSSDNPKGALKVYFIAVREAQRCYTHSQRGVPTDDCDYDRIPRFRIVPAGSKGSARRTRKNAGDGPHSEDDKMQQSVQYVGQARCTTDHDRAETKCYNHL